MEVNLVLQPVVITEKSIISVLRFQGEFICFTLEHCERKPKIHGKSGIPAGRYQLYKMMSSKFKRPMIYLANVPDFTGIMLHEGNTLADSRGCILCGLNMVGEYSLISLSKQAVINVNKLVFKLLENHKVFIQIIR